MSLHLSTLHIYWYNCLKELRCNLCIVHQLKETVQIVYSDRSGLLVFCFGIKVMRPYFPLLCATLLDDILRVASVYRSNLRPIFIKTRQLLMLRGHKQPFISKISHYYGPVFFISRSHCMILRHMFQHFRWRASLRSQSYMAGCILFLLYKKVFQLWNIHDHDIRWYGVSCIQGVSTFLGPDLLCYY